MNDDQIQSHKAIRKAIRQGNLPSVIELIGTDDSLLRMMTVFGTWLHFAALHGKLDIVEWLLKQGLDINANAGTEESAPIERAASWGHYEVVKYLLDCGAVLDVSEPTRNPLFSAIYGWHPRVVELLLKHGIDTHVSYTGKHMKNMDAIAFAREWGRTDIVALIEAHHRRN